MIVSIEQIKDTKMHTTTLTRTTPTAATRKPCDADPDLWFSSDPADQYEAMQACGFCPFRDACRAYGSDEIFGVWGAVVQGRTDTVVQPTMATCGLETCGREFVVRTASAKYCSPPCQKEAGKARARARWAAMSVCEWEGCTRRFSPKMKSQRFCSPTCGRLNKRKTAQEGAAAVAANEHLRELLDSAS